MQKQVRSSAYKTCVPELSSGRQTAMRGTMIALLAAAGAVAMAQNKVNFKVIDMPAEFSTIEQAQVIKIHSQSDWKDYWNRYITANVEDHGQWKPMPMPAVDFKLNDVV